MFIETATFVRRLDTWAGDARLYHLTRPAGYWCGTTDYVVVSAVDLGHGVEQTYIFPATPEGKAINLHKITGSYVGGLDHKKALSYAGYFTEENNATQR